MLVTDSDLVFKLRSLPYEEREALLRIVAVTPEGPEHEDPAEEARPAGPEGDRSRPKL